MIWDNDNRRKIYMEKASAIKNGLSGSLRHILETARQEVSIEIKDPRPPSWSTMYRWFKEENAGKNSNTSSGNMKNISANVPIRKDTLRLNESIIDPIKQRLIRRPKLTLYFDNTTNEILKYSIN